jgi:hypothetical protein
MTTFKVTNWLEFLRIAEPEEIRYGLEVIRNADKTLTIRSKEWMRSQR